jgi:hypothetical protein
MRGPWLIATALAGTAGLAPLAAAATPANGFMGWRDASSTLPARQAPGHSMAAQAADIDSDGDLDLVVAMEFRPNRLLLNDGRGVFADASARLPRTARDSEEVAVTDFNGDGRLDIAVANEDDIRQELYLQGADGSFVLAEDRLAVRVKANAVVAFDPDRDGDQDLFFGGNQVSVLMINDGSGRFTDQSLTWLPDTSAATQDVAVGDVDADGDADLLLGNEDRNQLYLNEYPQPRFRLASPGTLQRPGGGEETRDAELADLDGDGDLDAVFANVAMFNPNATPGGRILLNAGNGFFSDAPASWQPQAGRGLLSALPIRLPGDTRISLVVTGMPTALSGAGVDGRVMVLRNSGAGLSEDTSLLPAGLPGTVGMDAIAADFDGDGIDDIFVSGRAGPDLLLLSRR